MSKLILNPTDTSQWHALVNEAEAELSLSLCEELESYLVFMLIRYTQRPEFSSSALGQEYLVSQQHDGIQRQMQLRDVGDKCLLLAGLFPGNAPRRHVSLDYFVSIGQSAYSALSNVEKRQSGRLFAMLANGFVDMMDILQTLREQDGALSQMLPIDALELWQKHHSRVARAVLEDYNHHELSELFRKFS